MANILIKHKRGPEGRLGVLDVAEIALTTDTKKVVIGTAEGNMKLANDADVAGAVTAAADAQTAAQTAANSAVAAVSAAEAADLKAVAAQTAAEAAVQTATEAAKNYTDQAITDLKGGAPEDVDTLKEIADIVALIQNGSVDVTAIQSLINEKAAASDVVDLTSRVQTLEAGLTVIDGGEF